MFGETFYEYLSGTELRTFFNDDMAESAVDAAKVLTGSYDFGSATRIVDIGGGYGVLLAGILAANPRLHRRALRSATCGGSCRPLP